MMNIQNNFEKLFDDGASYDDVVESVLRSVKNAKDNHDKKVAEKEEKKKEEARRAKSLEISRKAFVNALGKYLVDCGILQVSDITVDKLDKIAEFFKECEECKPLPVKNFKVTVPSLDSLFSSGEGSNKWWMKLFADLDW